MSSKRIGIFAGTFDPIHKGHVAFALDALKHGLDKVYFLVEPRPRRKQGVHAQEHRVAMAQLAAKNHPGLGVIHLNQAKFTSHETLPILKARFADSELVLLFGDDVMAHMIDHLTEWPHVEALAESASLLIAARHHNVTELAERLKDLRRYGVSFNFEFIEGKYEFQSSSQIRASLKRGETPKYLPQVVAAYIKTNKLYASSNLTR